MGNGKIPSFQKFKTSITPVIDNCPICQKSMCEHTEPSFDNEADKMINEKRNGEIVSFNASSLNSPISINGNTAPNSPNPNIRIQSP